MPCRHAVAAIWNMATNGRRVGSLESWCNPIYTMARWKQVYAFKVNPINGRSLWVKSQVPTTLTPPNHHKQVGRPKKARKRSALEVEEMTHSGRLSKKHTKGKCGKCGHVGHNTRTCKGDATV
ncbi:putative transcription factor interactor and regulator CCHC(Zn) family [Helianthus annuus]|nr:putative transcription factor interactor and regulator CCHC(Zn) family [Helianthus annuus]